MVAVALVNIHHLFFALLNQVKDLIQGLQEGGAAGVQADFALDPIKQRGTGIVLHPGDDLAEGGLGDVQHHRRVADVLHMGHGAETIQLV